MSHIFDFLKTFIIAVTVASLVFFLFQLEVYFRTSPDKFSPPTPPYVSVLASNHGGQSFSWWRTLLNDIRLGN
ncbi:hypothetical protein [Alicyclobacillus fodiniaquatilis]|uniref:Uncharacterized protein n=1 Tax=Alicyclobacillus fodiniaquatilis TaxID=1661150 RepID=A0ABW4JHD1_9BACL